MFECVVVVVVLSDDDGSDCFSVVVDNDNDRLVQYRGPMLPIHVSLLYDRWRLYHPIVPPHVSNNVYGCGSDRHLVRSYYYYYDSYHHSHLV